MSPNSDEKYPGRSAGSPDGGEPVFLLVGKLRRTHGLRGELQMEVWTEFPERLEGGKTLYVGADYRPFRLRSVRQKANSLLVAFQDIRDPEQAAALRNQWVYIRADQVPPLTEGEFYHHQIVGLNVIDEGGETLGVVSGILETGSNDVLIVHPESGKDILLPFTDEVILEVDLQRGIVNVHLLPGLLP